MKRCFGNNDESTLKALLNWLSAEMAIENRGVKEGKTRKERQEAKSKFVAFKQTYDAIAAALYETQPTEHLTDETQAPC